MLAVDQNAEPEIFKVKVSPKSKTLNDASHAINASDGCNRARVLPGPGSAPCGAKPVTFPFPGLAGFLAGVVWLVNPARTFRVM